MNFNHSLILEKTNIFNNKQILITGASGLIGFNLLSHLHKLNSKLNSISIVTTSLNRLPNYLLDELGQQTFKHFLYEDFVEFYKDKNNCFDYIYHCAGYGQPKKFINKPFETVEVNTSQLIFISNLLKNNGKMFYMSSSEIYSNSKTLKPNEYDIGCVNPNHERAIYIESKKLGESICNSLNKMGKNIIILRISLVFGRGVKLNDERVLNEFIISGLKNNKIVLLDKGEALRTYLSIDQCLFWIFSLTHANEHSIYNISGNYRLSVRDLAEIIGKILGIEIELGLENGLTSAPKNVEIDNTRIMSEYPYLVQAKFENQIKEVIDWYRKLI